MNPSSALAAGSERRADDDPDPGKRFTEKAGDDEADRCQRCRQNARALQRATDAHHIEIHQTVNHKYPPESEKPLDLHVSHRDRHRDAETQADERE